MPSHKLNKLARLQALKEKQIALLNKKAAEGRFLPTSYAQTSNPSAYSIANILIEDRSKMKDLHRRRRMLQSFNLPTTGPNSFADHKFEVSNNTNPSVHFNESLYRQNYKFFGLSDSCSRNQAVRTQDVQVRQSAETRYNNDERSVHMPMHPMVDYSSRLVCS
jgi:hypothetical protein